MTGPTDRESHPLKQAYYLFITLFEHLSLCLKISQMNPFIMQSFFGLRDRKRDPGNLTHFLQHVSSIHMQYYAFLSFYLSTQPKK